MTVFEFDDYRDFVLARVAALPKGGRGEFRRLATSLGVHTTLISQVFSKARGRDLTIEQGAAMAEHWGLPEKEAQYLVALVERARAGTPTLRRMIERRLSTLREEARELSTRLPQDRKLTEKEQAVFYSRWTYSGVRLLAPLMRSTASSIVGQATSMATGSATKSKAGSPSSSGSVESIASKLGLSREHVAEVLEFLQVHGLLVQSVSGDWNLGANKIHVSSDSPLVGQHHRNWRMRALSRLESVHRLPADELMFTMPMSVADADRPRIRQLMLTLIDEVCRIVDGSEPDCLACVNLDFVKLAGG